MPSEAGNDVSDGGAAIEATPPSTQRVWPVFVAFVTVLGGVLLGGAVLAVVLVVLQEGRMPPIDELESHLGAIVVTPAALIASVSLSVSLLVSLSLVGGALSSEPLRQRVRLRRRSLPLLAYPVSVVGLLVVGQSLEYVAIWLGFRDGRSALDVLADSIAAMPLSAFVVFLIAGSLGAGVAEELFFRGYMQTRLTSRFGIAAGVIVSSIAFGILHLDPVHGALAFFMGIYLGWLAELAGTILLPIVAHVGNNFLAFVLIRSAENTDEAPISYFVISVAAAVVCTLVLARLVPSNDSVTSTQTNRSS